MNDKKKKLLLWKDEFDRPIAVQNSSNGRYISCPWYEFQPPGPKVVWNMMKDRISIHRNRVPKSQAQRKKYLPIVKEEDDDGNDISSSDTGSMRVNARWIGHATCLIRLLGGFTVLTDPVFSMHCAPVQAGIPRYTPPAISIQDMPKNIDIVLISHDHYDHLDINSLREIHEAGIVSDRGKYFVPMGIRALLLKKIKGLEPSKVVEMTWWESHSLLRNDDESTNNALVLDEAVHGREHVLSSFKVIVTCTPAQHWCSRMPYDRNKRLWCSWVVNVEGNNTILDDDSEELQGNINAKFYFAGDTGYTPDYQFHKIIGDLMGPFDFAAIPIGAYEPREVMSSQHCSPEEAVEIHLELQSKFSLAIHWGTWPLANEAFYEPAFRLKDALGKKGLSVCRDFVIARSGEVLSVPIMTDESETWEGIPLHPIFSMPFS